MRFPPGVQIERSVTKRGVVDDAFFSDGRFASQYLINIGFGDYTHAPPRLPRFDVDDIASYA